MVLTRRLASDEDVAKFVQSEAYNDVVDIITQLNEACKDQKIGYQEPVSPTVQKLSQCLKEVSALVGQFPARKTASRFGKPEFRDFLDALELKLPKLLPSDNEEVCEYFARSFGDRKRIDYGSGHELNFVCVLICLQKLDLIHKTDFANLSLGVFDDYFNVMRQIQAEYWLEPAGSHGVWGLDDYHFLPFVFGSSQLVNDPYVRPMSIHDEVAVDMYKDKYYYFQCIYNINRVKKTSLRWHSPMLDDISGVKKWSKVNEGLLKMYKAEVLNKLPIMQHFLFGELIKAPENVSEKTGDVVHIQCWADCCGIRVPSAIAAAGATKASAGHTLQRSDAVPID
ncbi:peptidylprolyl isomerase [Starmerella bacillaris]|uniref:Serine/threonine-protein phosphatase 2A activator n=1 Tax=Starmerella bacillaris TaxID=1247836 RepID=A0AAV5RMD2_STABA|nr:peptidylprolyl isomerase [Starmerella bacillaris]